jgi:hypothetical protein
VPATSLGRGRSREAVVGGSDVGIKGRRSGYSVLGLWFRFERGSSFHNPILAMHQSRGELLVSRGLEIGREGNVPDQSSHH